MEKIKDVPYFRLWFNIFNYTGKTNKKDFTIDILLLTLPVLIFYIILNTIIKLDYKFYYDILLIYYYVLVIPLLFRRIRDMKVGWWLIFFAFLGIFLFIAIFVGLCGDSKLEKETSFKEMEKGKKIATIILSVLIVLCIRYILIFGIFSFDFYYTSINGCVTSFEDDISNYQSLVLENGNAEEMMPKLEMLSDYKEIKFSYVERVKLFLLGFQEDCYSLFVSYENNYEQKKEEMLNSYDFLEEPILGEETHDMPVTSIEYNGYYYQIIIDNNYHKLCGSFAIFGYNDEKKEIAYHYYYDSDLDYLATIDDDLDQVMVDFMKNNFYYYE